MLTCMMFDWVRSKPFLGMMGNISAAMATVAAFGTAIYMGFDFIGINLAAPFLMVGKCRSTLLGSSLLRSRRLCNDMQNKTLRKNKEKRKKKIVQLCDNSHEVS